MPKERKKTPADARPRRRPGRTGRPATPSPGPITPLYVPQTLQVAPEPSASEPAVAWARATFCNDHGHADDDQRVECVSQALAKLFTLPEAVLGAVLDARIRQSGGPPAAHELERIADETLRRHHLFGVPGGRRKGRKNPVAKRIPPAGGEAEHARLRALVVEALLLIDAKRYHESLMERDRLRSITQPPLIRRETLHTPSSSGGSFLTQAALQRKKMRVSPKGPAAPPFRREVV